MPDLWAYIHSRGYSGAKCYANKIGGIADHIHGLFEQHRTVALSDLVGRSNRNPVSGLNARREERILRGKLAMERFR